MDNVTLNSLRVNPVSTANASDVPKEKKAEIGKIKKACQDFESIFTYYLLKTMRETVPKSSISSSSSGKDTYYMLMDQKVAEDLSKKGNGLGLQKMLFEQLTKNYTKEVSVSQEKVK
jgi:peptidoglycan hydrolase FlgJ